MIANCQISIKVHIKRIKYVSLVILFIIYTQSVSVALVLIDDKIVETGSSDMFFALVHKCYLQTH